MASRPATPSLPLAVLAEGRAAAVTPSPVVTGTIKEYKTPVDSEQKQRAVAPAGGYHRGLFFSLSPFSGYFLFLL